MDQATKDEMILNLIALTSCDADLARDILEGCDYNLETATNMFYDAQPHTREESKSLFGRPEPANPRPAPSQQTKPPARPSAPSSSRPVVPAKKPSPVEQTKPAPRKPNNYTSFEDLDPNFNKTKKTDKPTSLYTGGASSGLEVKSNAVHIIQFKNGLLIDGVPPLISTVGNDAAGVEGREILSAMDRKEIHPALAERIKDVRKDEDADELDVEVEKRLDEEYKETTTPSQRVAFQGEVRCFEEESSTEKKSGPCKKIPLDLGGAQADVKMKISMCGAPPMILEALSTHKLTDVMRHIGFVPKKIIRRSDNSEIDRHSWSRSLRHLKLNGQVLLFE